ncbi:uncharacterized protein LOC127869770 [Dreissena polymorpha]|uniref:uncharacterized protein LOC127869770 n=1 Tax=Dreissena polymorpha TaxID=45954 RepID=UPI0022642B2D|nr:uncharacterized protein LOC127869770 [Dreissena polymorpha]
MYMLQPWLKTQVSTKAPKEHVNVTNNILAGASALVVLVITVAVACVCRFYRRSLGSHVTENVVPVNNPAIERRLKRNVRPPFNGVMSRIYDEIDPGIFVSESPLANEDARMPLQGLTKVERYETLDRSGLRDESKYNTIVSC